MKVELAAGIESISGKCGNMIFKTYKRPNGKTETRAYFNPHCRWDKVNVRKTPPSDAEIKARSLFARRQAYVQELLASGRYHDKREAWKIAKNEIK